MQCKVGDLAIVIRSRNAESLGAVVEVVRPFRWSSRDGANPMWWVRTTGRVLKAVGGFSGDSMACREGGIEDSHLRPISGVPASAEQEDAAVA